jgi:hypothetical protein
MRPRQSLVPTVNYGGVIEVKNTDSGTLLGYVSKKSLGNGGYGYADITQALIVEFSLPGDATAGTVQMTTAVMRA